MSDKMSSAERARVAAAMLAAGASARARINPVLVSAGLTIRDIPYAAPLSTSIAETQAAMAQVMQGNPYDKPITGSLQGPGTMVLSLPSGLDDTFVTFSAILLDVTFSNNDAPSPFKVSLAGTYVDGPAYSLPPFEVAFNPGANFQNQMLILVAESTRQGPRMRAGRITNTSWATQYTNGGVGSVSAQGLSVTISDANPNMQFNAAIITASHQWYTDLSRLLAAACVAGVNGITVADFGQVADTGLLDSTPLEKFRRIANR